MASSASATSAPAWSLAGLVAIAIEVETDPGTFVDTAEDPPISFPTWKLAVKRHVNVPALGGTCCTLGEGETFRIKVSPLAGPIICRITVDGNRACARMLCARALPARSACDAVARPRPGAAQETHAVL